MNEHCRGCIRYLKSCSGMSKEVCEKHKLRIPRTNADIIRSMTDEELAKFLTKKMYARIAGDWKKWLDWLKKEAKEGEW